MYNYCEGVFFANGPFFHIYTTPPEKNLLFVQDEDYREATNMLAFASEDSGVRILAYAIMSNHLHIILSAGRERCDAFIAELHRKTNHFIRKRGRAASSISFNILEIKDIKQMKDEIAYVIRNPYAARNDVNPFAHPWSSGYLYFNEMLSMLPQGTPATNLSIRARRDLKHSRDAEMPSSFKVSNGMILPQSFVDYQMAMSFFENARQFVWYSTRKVEAYTATAERLGEKMLLTDEEVFQIAFKYSSGEFGQNSPRLLPIVQKRQLILVLKNEFGASNKQISRCAGLPLAFINEMFPSANLVK